MQRSFTEAGKLTQMPAQQQKLIDIKKQKIGLEKELKCEFVSPYEEIPMNTFYSQYESLLGYCKDLWKVSTFSGLRV